MSQTVSHGSNAERLDDIAGNLQSQSHRVDDIAERGTAMVHVLEDAWQGGDLEHFCHEWTAARQQVAQAAQTLQQAVDRLRAEADQQRRTSDAGGPDRGVGGSREPVSPDNNDARDGFGSWLRRLFGDDPWSGTQDPGAGQGRLPEGADPDDPMIQEMQATPQGRATLDWMARNGIEIIVDPNQQGAIYDAGLNAMVIGPGYDNSSTIIHEASHARWDAEDRPVDATEVPRDEYLDNRLRDETEAVATEVSYAKQQREAGVDVPVSRAEQDYDAARQSAIDAGKSPEEADQAGQDAIYELFTSGYYTTSNTGQTYPEYYGSHWDSVN